MSNEEAESMSWDHDHSYADMPAPGSGDPGLQRDAQPEPAAAAPVQDAADSDVEEEEPNAQQLVTLYYQLDKYQRMLVLLAHSMGCLKKDRLTLLRTGFVREVCDFNTCTEIKAVLIHMSYCTADYLGVNCPNAACHLFQKFNNHYNVECPNRPASEGPCKICAPIKVIVDRMNRNMLGDFDQPPFA